MTIISPEELRMYIEDRCKNCKNKWFHVSDVDGSDWFYECARVDDEALNCNNFEKGENE